MHAKMWILKYFESMTHRVKFELYFQRPAQAGGR